ncbi:unnamed protein product, partial [Mycena citricolor]
RVFRLASAEGRKRPSSLIRQDITGNGRVQRWDDGQHPSNKPKQVINVNRGRKMSPKLYDLSLDGSKNRPLTFAPLLHSIDTIRT